jgi:hypothetical protein
MPTERGIAPARRKQIPGANPALGMTRFRVLYQATKVG